LINSRSECSWLSGTFPGIIPWTIWMLISAMLVVSNTSPLSNLAIINRLEVLREQLGEIIIPGAVNAELAQLSHSAGRERLRQALGDGWVRVRPLASAIPPGLAISLHPGEAETLALALEVKASLVLLDESAARLKAAQLGLAHTGLLGILRHAKQAGLIRSLSGEIRLLRTEARFFVSPALEKRLLIRGGD
jgi:predicted nucleic acid-binding protein